MKFGHFCWPWRIDPYDAAIMRYVLTVLDQSQQREQLLTKTIQAARRTAQLARRQYVEGAADLQTIFDAQRGLTEVEEAYVLALQQRLEASISLHRAIGGALADIDPTLRYALE
jgi:outer membrane protein TolC